jgi:hypothetical protein
MPRRPGRITTRALLLTLVVLITVAAIGLTVVGAVAGPSLVREWRIASLDGQAATFLAAPAKTPDPDEKPYVRSKLVVLDVKKRHIDPFYRQLPDDLVAQSADEVGTVVWIDWEVDGETAPAANSLKAPVTKLTLIDRERGQSLGDFRFPYDYEYTDARRTAIRFKRPVIAVGDYLKSLPRR